MARETIILTRQEVAQQISLEDIIPAIENCLAQFEKGEDLLPPKCIVDLPGGVAACLTGYTKSTHMFSMKIGQERKVTKLLEESSLIIWRKKHQEEEWA